MTTSLVRGIGVVTLGVVLTLSAQTVASARAFQDCRGVTVDRTAPVVSRASVLIKAPLARIWRLHTDIDHWQSWIPEITPAHKETPGPLRPGSVFPGRRSTCTSSRRSRPSSRCAAPRGALP